MSITTQQLERFDGLGILYFEVSAMNPLGVSYVVCDKHPKNAMVVNMDFFEKNGFKRGDAILQAFKSCPGCMEIETNKNTRWPEGAEL